MTSISENQAPQNFPGKLLSKQNNDKHQRGKSEFRDTTYNILSKKPNIQQQQNWKSCKETGKCGHTKGKIAVNINCLWVSPYVGFIRQSRHSNYYIYVQRTKGNHV